MSSAQAASGRLQQVLAQPEAGPGCAVWLRALGPLAVESSVLAHVAVERQQLNLMLLNGH